MKVGDFVKVKKPSFIGKHEARARVHHGHHGIIIDAIEMEDGFFEYEVLFENEVDWFGDLELEVINESAKEKEMEDIALSLADSVV
jgi:hypothetical protein